MYKKLFKELAEKENGKFYYQDNDIAIGGGVRSPNVIFKIKFKYKDNEFTIINRTGTAYVGTISCELSKDLQPIEFELNTISHLKNLFLRKKSRFKINTHNRNLKDFLSKNSSLKLLSKIADKEDFSPIITCQNDCSWEITTKYHLEFDNWTQVLEPIIELYKELIDEFEKRIANISSKAYRELN
ncbi:hypothetical protein [uncultured Aquimarina sp.]|uniref:hypothetical protein n=1 Tax=uncultured Aquimarina sp. TaxID=575652 RepID=UPI00262A67BC|nr:hypothetical protein [uncultured Aquimarina sp.]